MALQLFQSYPSGRQQYVSFGNVASHRKNAAFGVPRGSVLGPLFYLLYMYK